MTIPSQARLQHPDTVRTFRNLQRLVLGYLAISVLALAAIVVLRNDKAAVNTAVWTRAVIVVATGLLLILLATRAARGSRGAYLRLRIVSVITPVAIAVIIALPGTFPVWLKLEQAVCGLVMAGVAVLANGRELRGLFAAGPQSTP